MNLIETLEALAEELDKVKVEATALNKKLDDREADLIEAKREERERIEIKLKPFFGCIITSKDWQDIKGVEVTRNTEVDPEPGQE